MRCPAGIPNPCFDGAVIQHQPAFQLQQLTNDLETCDGAHSQLVIVGIRTVPSFRSDKPEEAFGAYLGVLSVRHNERGRHGAFHLAVDGAEGLQPQRLSCNSARQPQRWPGLGQSGVAQVASAFEKKEKPAVVWMHFQECTCCSESFIRASHPIVVDALLDVLSLNYTETLMAASGFQAEKSLNDTIKNNKGKYIVLVEGAVPTNDGGVYCMIGGKTAESILQDVAKDAAAVVAWGSCASNGCVQAAKPNPTGATPIHKLVDKPVINVPGCPPIADVMMGVVTHLLVLGQIAGARQPGTAEGILWPPRARHVLSPRRTTMPGCSWSHGTTRTRARDIACTRWAAKGR